MSDLIKENIKHCFNKAWKSYDNACVVQKNVGDDLLALLLRYVDGVDRVADFACGTGVSTQLLVDKLSCQQLYAVDIAENLLAVAQKKLSSDVKFLLSDFDKIVFPDDVLDVIFCNMGLQWSINLARTLRNFHRYLHVHGRLAFSIPIDGTFVELKSRYINPTYQEGDIKHLLAISGFDLVESKCCVYKQQFDSPLAAIRSIKAVGANYVAPKALDKKSFLSRGVIADMFVDKEKTSLSYCIGMFVVKKRKCND